LVKLRDKQKAAVKSALIQAGEQLFETKGYLETTIEEITVTAGVARGTFYNYFQTKEDLALEMVYETEDVNTETAYEIFDSIPGCEDQIRAILASAAEWTQRRPELVWVSMMEKVKRGATPQGYKASLFRRMITEAFALGQINSVVSKERSPESLANDIDGLYMIHMARWYHSGKKVDLITVLLPAVNTYLSGAIIKS